MKRRTNHIRIFLLMGLLSAAIGGQAQSAAYYDSLRKVIVNAKEDTFKVKALIQYANFMPFRAPDSALIYADSIINLSTRLSYSYGIQRGLHTKAYTSQQKGDFPLALSYYKKVLEYATRDHDALYMTIALERIGDVYGDMGDTILSLHFVRKSDSLLWQLPDLIPDRLLGTYGQKEFSYRIDQNTATAYLRVGKTDSAQFFVERAMDNYRKIHKNGMWSALAVVLGNIYLEKKDYRKAIEAFQIPTDFNFSNDSANNYLGRAEAYMKLPVPDSAIYYCQAALTISKRLHYPIGILGAAELLSEAYKESNPAEAYTFLKLSTAVKDSIYGKEKINQLNALQRTESEAQAAQKAASTRIQMQALMGGLFTLLIAVLLIWRNSRQRKLARNKIEKAYENLKATQEQLVQSEKMASLGELTAGIAHEIQNPLNFVNNFSEVNKELIDEMNSALQSGNVQEAIQLSKDLQKNLEKINEHGKRADSIVKGMLQHSRTSSGQKEDTDINALCDEYLRLAYHGMRARDKSFNAVLKTDFDPAVGKIQAIPQELGRVLLNLYNNAFYAVDQKAKMNANGYQPTVSVSTKRTGNKINIEVTDNGNGIPEKIKDKIFQPFFTTKPTGQGTGLGLSLSYDIIKAHAGKISVLSKDGSQTQFVIELPTS